MYRGLKIMLILSVLALCIFNLSACQDTPTITPDEIVDTECQSTLPPNSESDNFTTPAPSVLDETPVIEGVPVIRITTSNGEAIPDNKNEVNCSVTLSCSVDSYCKDDLSALIRVRGNGSLSVAKSTGKYSYKLKFDSKINLFGLGEEKAKDWCLLSSVTDRTMLRNYTGKRLGDMLSGIPFSSNTMHVKVFLNDKFLGLYELTEQVEVGNARVCIDDTQKGEENGFLVEADYYAKSSKDPHFTVGKNDYTIKSDIHNQEQFEYVKDYIQKLEMAINLGNKSMVESLCDIESLVDMYILQEFIKNTDAGYSSFYMCKDVGGKLYFTAPWDFDLAVGNDELVDNGDYKNIYIGKSGVLGLTHHEWYIRLYSCSWFLDLVKERWAELSDTVIVDLIKEVEIKAKDLMPVLISNYALWTGVPKQIGREPVHVYTLNGAKAHTDFLIDWLNNRKNWLDEYWKI